MFDETGLLNDLFEQAKVKCLEYSHPKMKEILLQEVHCMFCPISFCTNISLRKRSTDPALARGCYGRRDHKLYPVCPIERNDNYFTAYISLIY